MQHESPARRRLLAATGAMLTTALAGCSSLPDGGRTSEQLVFEELHQTPTYVAEGVDIDLHEEIPTVSAKNNADLLLLPGDTDTGAEQAADWLTDDRWIALLGDAAEATWLDWEASDAFDDAFENRGAADSDPDPDLLVGTVFENRTATYRRTWADGPRDRDLVRALDEILVAIEERTPR